MRIFTFDPFRISLSIKYLKSILQISLPTTPKILFGQINTKIDKILISIFSSLSATGIYSIAQSLSSVIFQIMTSLDKVFITQTNKMLFKKFNWPIIDVTRKSVEETAASVIRIYEIKKGQKK